MSLTSSNPSAVSIALSRCRFAVIACCWLIGLALASQMFIWSLATFTELRFEAEPPPGDAPLIVHAEPDGEGMGDPRRSRERRAVPRPDAAIAPDDQQQEQSQRVLSRNDHRFAGTFNITAGLGQCAMLMLTLVIGLTVMLAAASGLSSVDRAVSSFLWLLLVAMLVLPMGNFFTLPWQQGALTTYSHMTTTVDQLHHQRRMRLEGIEHTAGEESVGRIEFYVRFGLLPAACIVGITLVGLRYCAALEGTLPQRERMRLDPALEREAANITPTSLHGGRSGGVFNRAIGGGDAAAIDQEKAVPSARSVTPGEQPRRLI